MRYREHYKKSYEMDSTWKEEALKMKGHLEEAIKTEMREKDMTDSTLPELRMKEADGETFPLYGQKYMKEIIETM